MRRGLWILGGILVVGLLIAGVLLLTQKNPWTGEVQPLSMTPEDEAALGIQLAPRVSDALGGLDLNADTQGMVTTVGDRVAAASAAGGSPYRFQFHVLADTALVEAFALPGGPVLISRGLLDRLENEAQLAGAIAHQVAHVLARHAAERFTRADTTEAAVRRMLYLRYDANDETEADSLAVRLLGTAGYDPRALIGFLRIAQEAARSSGGRGFAARHADPGDRTRLLTEAIARAYPEGVPSTLTLGRWFAPEPPEPTDPMESLHPADSASVLD
jgi:predicted Zn-dependent protease